MKVNILTGISLLIVCSVPAVVKAETINCSRQALEKGDSLSQANTRFQSGNNNNYNNQQNNAGSIPCNYTPDGTATSNDEGTTNNSDGTTNNSDGTTNNSDSIPDDSGDASK